MKTEIGILTRRESVPFLLQQLASFEGEEFGEGVAGDEVVEELGGLRQARVPPGGTALQARPLGLTFGMVLIRFTDAESKRRALETLAGEFSFKTWSSGQMLVPEDALAQLAHEDIPFTFEGSTAYEKLASLRDPAASAV
jgi:hypothetical protein